MNRKISFGLGLLLFTVFSGLLITPAFAVPIAFSLGPGGIVSYAGGASPFITTNGLVTSVSNGTTTMGVSGGDLDFSTGAYTGGAVTSTGFVNYFAPGGSVSISGDIGSGTTTLLSGSFTNAPTFNCCLGFAPLLYISSFGGLLDISYVDSSLASILGFNLPATGGAIAQVEIDFGFVPAGPGLPFLGIQGVGAVAVADSRVAVPEPSSLLLLGSGLIGLGLWGRRRSKSKN